MNTLKTVSDSTTLLELAVSINAEHHEIVRAFRCGLEHARKAGMWLLTAKGQLVHGQWEEWVKYNLNCSKRTVETYMQIAKRWDDLQSAIKQKAQDPADIGLEKALRLIAIPKVPKTNIEKEPLESSDTNYAATEFNHVDVAEKPRIQSEFEDVQNETQVNTLIELYHGTLSKLVQVLDGLAVASRHLPIHHQLLEKVVGLIPQGKAALDRIEASVPDLTEVENEVVDSALCPF